MLGRGDTIFAVASGVARSAISVMRISGPATAALLQALGGPLPPPRRATLRTLRDERAQELDRGIVLWMPGPASYTGEDSAELHLHGGLAVRSSVSAALLSLGARPAEPGEFSRRAYLAGKMGLFEAEAVADLVNAETEGQARQALRRLSGVHSKIVSGWASRLKRALAFQEALIDFPDESLPESVEAELLENLSALRGEMEAELARAPAGERLRTGLVFAIVGAPNVGKSSLLNALARREVAIVSPVPGTTRDALEVSVDLDGLAVTLIDTAGLRETHDEVEAEGVRRARSRASTADLTVCVVDAASPNPVLASDILVANKTDLAPAPSGMLGISVVTGEGFSHLEARLAAEARRLTGAGADPVLSRGRHVAAVRDASAAIAAALLCTLPELRAEELRLALEGLGRLTGAVDAESVLDDVFGAFCIGK